MKFYCDKCQAKYSIADEKVRGKVLKVRCKKCAHVITVREPRAPAAVAQRPPSLQQPQRSPAWFYALNGQTFGPYDEATLVRMYESGEVGDASYVWNESFVEWLPVRQVPVFAPALERGSAIRPRHKTIGVSGALESIKIDQLDTRRQQELSSLQSDDQGDELEEAGAVPGQMADRIDALRDKLKQHQRAPESTSPTNPFAKKQSAQGEPLQEKKAPAISLAKKAELQDDPTSQMSFAEISGLLDLPQDKLPAPADDQEDLTDDTSLSGLDLESSSVGDEVDGAGDLFSGLDAVSEPGLTLDTHEEIPAFLGAPAMPESSIDFSRLEKPDREDGHAGLFVDMPAPSPDRKVDHFQTSNSLLIQMSSIQKEGRGKRFTLIAGITLLFVVLGVVAVIAAQNAQKNAKDEPQSTAYYDDGKKELEFRTYSKQERAGLFMELDEEAEIIRADSPIEDEPESDDVREDPIKKTSPNRVVARNDTRKPTSNTGPNLRGMSAILNQGSSRDEALQKSRRSDGSHGASGLNTKAGGRAKGVNGGDIGAAKRTKNPTFKAPPNISSRSRSSIGPNSAGAKEKAEAKKKPALGQNGALSQKDAKKGFRKISRSVQSCHQRQVTRGLPIDAPKVFLTVTIENSGKVSGLKIEPSSLSSSEFASCLKSHRRGGRWAFTEFSGEPVKIRHTYVLQ